MCITTSLILSTHPLSTEVGQREAHEMSTRTSGRNDKVSGASASNAPAEQADHEDQAGSSTRPQAQAKRDGPSNSGEFPSTLVTLDLTRYEQNR